MRDGALRRGSYRPNSPPPPSVAPPPEAYGGSTGDRWMEGRSRPNRVVRQRSYARAEAKHLRGREQERVRSRSPVRSHGCRDEWPQYRDPSPMRREPMNSPFLRDDRRRKTDEGMRCFACNEPGHRAVDCSIAQQSGGKACFRCGETGHIARACRVHIDEARTEAEVAAGDSDSGFNGNYGNDRGDDNRWSPPHRATADGHASANKREPQEQSSVLPSCAGYYVEDEVDWGDGDGHVRQAKYEKSHQPHVHPQREFMVREPYLGLPHLKNANIDNVPPTVQDLRGYDYRIKFMYESKPKTQRFVNGGNGKVAPARYGSEQRHDLGLCFATFLTRKRCEMGVRCPWRHHPLSNAEKAWIVEYGKKKGKEFIDNVDRWWSFPEVPVPGATMHGLGDKDT